jgi:glucose-1-phosphate adenylyltransferase
MLAAGAIGRTLAGWPLTTGEMEDCVILPDVEIGNNVILRRVVVDKRCRLSDRLKAGVDPEANRKGFHVTDRGVIVIPRGALANESVTCADSV